MKTFQKSNRGTFWRKAIKLQMKTDKMSIQF